MALKLVFGNGKNNQRQNIGRTLIKQLPEFQVGVHTLEPEINITKLITYKEIDDNQDFFENCAKDYRNLGKELIFRLGDELDINLNDDFPMETFNGLRRDKRSVGKVENWRYYVHGFHCGFENYETGQQIEVPLVFGLDFGDLDPYFFTQFIKSSSNYKPLPVAIFEDYADGVRIIERMVELRKFEKISSNVGSHYGVVVVDREKVDIKSHSEIDNIYKRRNKLNKKPKFNFWKLIGLQN